MLTPTARKKKEEPARARFDERARKKIGQNEEGIRKSRGDMACYTCGKQGHISRECPDKPRGGGRYPQAQPGCKVYVGNLDRDTTKVCTSWTIAADAIFP
jgi:hypothetical protein